MKKRKVKKTINKKVRNAKKVTYDGINFKSRLELYCYKQLKEADLEFQYEEHTYCIIESFTFSNESYEEKGVKDKNIVLKTDKIRGIRYTPDFVSLKHKFIIETKGNPNDAFPLRWKLFKKYITDNNLNFDLYLPRNQRQVNDVINIILNKNEGQ